MEPKVVMEAVMVAVISPAALAEMVLVVAAVALLAVVAMVGTMLGTTRGRAT